MKDKKKISSEIDIVVGIGDQVFKGIIFCVKKIFENSNSKFLSSILNFKANKRTSIVEDDLLSTKEAKNFHSLGFDILNRKDISFDKYNSEVPLSLIIGPPNFGKTNLMYNLIDRDLSLNVPFMMIDPKASSTSKESIKKLCRKYNKNLIIFDVDDLSSNRFNPLSGLNSTQIVQSIMRIFPNGHEYYGPRSSELLLDSVNELLSERRFITFKSLYDQLEKKSKDIDLKEFCEVYLNISFSSDDKVKEKFKAQLNKNRRFAVDTQAIRSNLKLLLNSKMGKLFDGKEDELINVDKIRQNNACAYISIPSLSYGDLAFSVGKVFISELMPHAYKTMSNIESLEKSRDQPLRVYIDEAGDVLFKNFKILASQCRESNINMVLGTQSLSDSEMISSTFKKQMNSYIGNLWIFRIPDSQDANEVAAFFGTKPSSKSTIQIDNGRDTGVGTERETEEFIVHPNILKSLPRFKAIYKGRDCISPTLVSVRDFDKSFNTSNTQAILKTKQGLKKEFDGWKS